MKKIIFTTILIAVALIVIFFTPNKKQNITNQMCPVMTAEEVNPDLFYDYKGQRVYLCCKRCVKKFSTNPEKYAKNIKFTAEQQVEISFGKRLIVFLGKLHPVAVHFPIALFFAALIAELYRIARKKQLQEAIDYCLDLAALSSIVAVALGWCAYLTSVYKDELVTIAKLHTIAGMIASVLMIVLAWLNRKKQTVTNLNHVYWGLSFATASVIGITGFWGASLIFGLEHLSW